MQRTMTKRASLAAFIASVALLLAFCMPSAAFADDQGVYRDSYNVVDVSSWDYVHEQYVYSGNQYHDYYINEAFKYDGTLTFSNPSYRGTFLAISSDNENTGFRSLPYTFDFDPTKNYTVRVYGFIPVDDYKAGFNVMANVGDTALPYEEYGKKYFNTGLLTKPFEQLGAWCVANAAKVIPFACVVMGIAIVILVVVRRYKKMVK